ncbi:BgTH12-03215, partial [Blumeria graminis f. sp. triticale]
IPVLPIRQDSIANAVPPAEVTKIALRLRYLIKECIPYEVKEKCITNAHSKIITTSVLRAASEAGGYKERGCVVFCLLVNKRWFGKQAASELWDSELHQLRATACDVIAKNLIEMEDNQQYLMSTVLLTRYKFLINGRPSVPANVIERAVDLHALRVIGSCGYQKCVKYLWRGWLVQDDNNTSQFVEYKKKANPSYWAHVDPDRMRAPVYQNAAQVVFSLIYLGLFTGSINTVNRTGSFDIVEITLYLFTLGFLCDEFNKFRKVGYWYIRFWNVFNLILYGLLTSSMVLRIVALSHPIDNSNNLGNRDKFNELSYRILAFSAPMFWMRLLLYFDSIRFFGTMLIVLKVMMSESLIFFALLAFIFVGFLQAFIGMDAADSSIDATSFILQAMVNAVMQSPDLESFNEFAPPFGIILYYIFTFLIMVILLNILIALFNSAYEDITDNAIDEYLALFAQKTIQFVRAPDENVFIAPLNLVEIVFLILPFEWWLPRQMYTRLNKIVMKILYCPLLLVTAYFETRSAAKVLGNRRQGEIDDDILEEWEQMLGECNFEAEGWKNKVEKVKPNPQVNQTTLAVGKLRYEVTELKTLVQQVLENREVLDL